MTLTTTDWVIRGTIIVYMIMMVGIGFAASGKNKNFKCLLFGRQKARCNAKN